MTSSIASVFTAFFERGEPVSTIAKPSCMNITRNAARRTHARLSEYVFISAAPVERVAACRRRRRTSTPGRRSTHRPREQQQRADHERENAGPKNATGDSDTQKERAVLSVGAISQD